MYHALDGKDRFNARDKFIEESEKLLLAKRDTAT